MNIGNAVVTFLQRPSALETWRYERRVFLAFEALFVAATMAAAPASARWVALASALVAAYTAELARADRSAAARKRERAEALGLPGIELECERDIEAAAKARQVLSILGPLLVLSATRAVLGEQGMTASGGVLFAVAVVRTAMVQAYGPWRRWYREQIPVRLDVSFSREGSGLAERAMQATRLDGADLVAKRDRGTIVITVQLRPHAIAVFDRAERSERIALRYLAEDGSTRSS